MHLPNIFACYLSTKFAPLLILWPQGIKDTMLQLSIKFMNLNAKPCFQSKVDFWYQTSTFHTFYEYQYSTAWQKMSHTACQECNATMRIQVSVISIQCHFLRNSHIYPISAESAWKCVTSYVFMVVGACIRKGGMSTACCRHKLYIRVDFV